MALLSRPGGPGHRARAIGTWSALGALGAALGPVIGGSLVQISWRWVFWINLPVGLAAVLLAARVVPESKDDHVRGRPDLLGAALLAAGSASLPPDRFGTGSGILNMGRQVGTVLGVAGLVAILAHVDRSDPIATYQHGLVLIIAFFVSAAVVAAILLTTRTIRRPAPSASPAGSVSPARSVGEVPAVEVVGG